MNYTLSIVNIISDQYRDAINKIAKSYGTGDNAMSVKLVDKDNNVFWGCHSWWRQQDYDYFTKAAPPETIPKPSLKLKSTRKSANVTADFCVFM